MDESKLLAELERRFPWLTVDAESDDYDEPSGADVIADLVDWHKDARRDASNSVAETLNRLVAEHWDRIAAEGAYAAAEAMCELAAELLGLDLEALKTRSVAASMDASPEDKEQAVAERLNKAIEKREAYEQALRDVEALTGEIDDLGDYLEYPASDVIAMGEGGAQ